MSSPIQIFYCSFGSGLFRPHLHSQILPHIERLSTRGFHFRVITTEPTNLTELQKGMQEEGRIRLRQAGSQWERLVPAGFARTAREISNRIRKLPSQTQPDLLHARGIASGVIVAWLARRMARPWVYDPRVVFSEVAEFQDPSRKTASKAKRILFRHLDWVLALQADAVRLESEQHRDWYLRMVPKPLRYRINACIDINSVDTARFHFDPQMRKALRARLGIKGDRPIIVYSGSVLGDRNLSEMCQFIRHFEDRRCAPFFLILTHHSRDQVRREVFERELNPHDFHVACVPHSQVPGFLSAADAAIVFHGSKAWRFSFPLKLGEYLSTGLPVVLNDGFGGAGEFIRSNQAGIVLKDLSQVELKRSAQEFMSAISNGTFARSHCRRVAQKFLSLEGSVSRLEHLYRSLK